MKLQNAWFSIKSQNYLLCNLYYITAAAELLGYKSLCLIQKETVQLWLRRNMFACLTTDSRNLLWYYLLPATRDNLCSWKKQSIVVVASPIAETVSTAKAFIIISYNTPTPTPPLLSVLNPVAKTHPSLLHHCLLCKRPTLDVNAFFILSCVWLWIFWYVIVNLIMHTKHVYWMVRSILWSELVDFLLLCFSTYICRFVVLTYVYEVYFSLSSPPPIFI